MNSLGELAMASRYRRPSHRRMLTLTVAGRERVGPHFVTLTLGGDDFEDLEQAGYDQSGRLFFGGQLPTSERWMLPYSLMPAARRPRVRTYTIRRFRPSGFDLEIVTHDGSAGAGALQPGDRVAFLDEGRLYAPPADATWQLLAGDETALPAVLAILERSRLPAEVFLEVPTGDDVRRGVTTPAGSRIHWLPRDDPATRPGTLALAAVRRSPLRPGRFHAWAAGESALATGVRRHLVTERGVPKSDVTFRGYWRHGRAGL